ncbi:MAG: hypothetical protein U1E76_08560 [Planctomycetota bacterium]
MLERHPVTPVIGRRAVLVALALETVVTLAFFWPFLRPGQAFFAVHNASYSGWREILPEDLVRQVERAKNPLMTDDLLMFHPEVLLSVESLERGSLPTWNPYAFGGYPHIATGIPALYYPLMALHLCLDPLRAYGLAAAVQALLAAFTLSLFLLRVGLSDWAAALGGLVFAYSGWMTAHMLYYQVSGASAWIGLMLLGVELVLGGHRRWGPAALALAVGLSFASGFPQTAFMNVYVALAYGAIRLITLPRSFPSRLGMAWQLAWPVGLGTMLAACQLVPSAWLTVAGMSNRPIPSLDQLEPLKLPPVALLTWFLPNLFGHPTLDAKLICPDNHIHLLARAHIPGYAVLTNYAEMQAYAGLLPWVLLFLGARRAQRRLWWLAIGLLAIAAAAACGTPVWRALSLLPGIRVGDPKRFLLPASTALAIVSAIGVDRLPDVRRSRIVLWLAILAGAAALGVALWLHIERERFPAALAGMLNGMPAAAVLEHVPAADFEINRTTLLATFLRAGLLLATAGLLLLLGSRSARGKLTVVSSLVLLASLDLLIQGRDGIWSTWLGPGFNRPLPTAQFLSRHPLLEAMRSAAHEPFRVIRFGDEWLFPPKTLQPYGIEDAQGYAALYLARYQKFIEAIPGTATAGCTAVQALQTEDALRAPAIDLLNVRFVLTRDEISAPGYRLFAERDGIRVYENLEAWPRAFVARDAEVLPGTAAVLARITHGDISRDTVLLEHEPAAHPTTAPTERLLATQVTWTSRDATSANLEVTSAGGFLVLADTFDPSWSAWVDDQAAPIEPAYGAFRAVAIASGTHRVLLRHAALAERTGLALTGAALLIWLACVLRPRWPIALAKGKAEGHGGDGN